MHDEHHHEEEKHYVCHGGCHGSSDKPGVCQAQGCADHGQALHECHCRDEKHGEEDVIIEN